MSFYDNSCPKALVEEDISELKVRGTLWRKSFSSPQISSCDLPSAFLQWSEL